MIGKDPGTKQCKEINDYEYYQHPTKLELLLFRLHVLLCSQGTLFKDNHGLDFVHIKILFDIVNTR